MVHNKKYNNARSLIVVFLFFQTLYSMKNNVKFGYNLIFNFKNEPNFIDTKSIKILKLPFLQSVEKSLALEKNIIVTINKNNDILIFDIEKNVLIKTIETGRIKITALAQATENVILTGHKNGSVSLWDITKKDGDECLKIIFDCNPTKNNEDYDFSPKILSLTPISQDMFVSCSANGIIKVFQWTYTNTKCCINATVVEANGLLGIIAKKNNEILFWNSTGAIKIIDVKNNIHTPLHTYKIAGVITAVKKISETKYLIGYANGSIVELNIDGNNKKVFAHNKILEQTYTFEEIVQNGIINILEIPECQIIVSNTSKKIIFTDPKTLQKIGSIDCSNILKKDRDYIVSLLYIEKSIVAITESGFILRIPLTGKIPDFIGEKDTFKFEFKKEPLNNNNEFNESEDLNEEELSFLAEYLGKMLFFNKQEK